MQEEVDAVFDSGAAVGRLFDAAHSGVSKIFVIVFFILVIRLIFEFWFNRRFPPKGKRRRH